MIVLSPSLSKPLRTAANVIQANLPNSQVQSRRWHSIHRTASSDTGLHWVTSSAGWLPKFKGRSTHRRRSLVPPARFGGELLLSNNKPALLQWILSNRSQFDSQTFLKKSKREFTNLDQLQRSSNFRSAYCLPIEPNLWISTNKSVWTAIQIDMADPSCRSFLLRRRTKIEFRTQYTTRAWFAIQLIFLSLFKKF